MQKNHTQYCGGESLVGRPRRKWKNAMKTDLRETVERNGGG
jgi:hypothetical protein